MSNQTSLSNGGYPAGTKIYRAIITQTGTNAPVANVLTNTLGALPAYGRTASTRYTITLARAFPANRTFASIAVGLDSPGGGYSTAGIGRLSDDVLNIRNDGDGAMEFGFAIEIIVYPA